jgi:hypothetical protein
MVISRMFYLCLIMLLLAICLLSMPGCAYQYPRHDMTCTVSQIGSGAIVSCPDGSTSVISGGSNGVDGINGSNGQDGEDGQDGQNGTPGRDAILTVTDPCGDGPGVDEVILKLADGSYIAWYYGVGMFVLTSGNWTTTDMQHCTFNLDSNGVITW